MTNLMTIIRVFMNPWMGGSYSTISGMARKKKKEEKEKKKRRRRRIAVAKSAPGFICHSAIILEKDLSICSVSLKRKIIITTIYERKVPVRSSPVK